MGASGWGYRGYAYVVAKNPKVPIIVKMYSVQVLGIQEAINQQ